jgi:transposase
MSINVLMDIIACDGGTVSLSTALGIPGSPIATAVGKRRRRSWSDDEKRRIVAETLCPGASVADIARRHGMNANLLFNWRRTARARCSACTGTTAPAERTHPDPMAAPSDNGFMPIGVFACAPDGGPALIAGPAAATPPLRPAPEVRAEVDKRVGLIEIDLADGTRLRVDAFVNQRALQRVLTVLKARS